MFQRKYMDLVLVGWLLHIINHIFTSSKSLWNEESHGEKIIPKSKNSIKQIIAMKWGSPKMQSSKIGGSQFGATYV